MDVYDELRLCRPETPLLGCFLQLLYRVFSTRLLVRFVESLCWLLLSGIRFVRFLCHFALSIPLLVRFLRFLLRLVLSTPLVVRFLGLFCRFLLSTLSFLQFLCRPDSWTPQPVRFIRLLPAQSRDDHLECELFIGSLDGGDDYEALSYTWGTTENPVTILVQGSSRQVTQNLAAALRRLRLPDRPRVLWIDALCINQADNDEKSWQVAQMRRIYTGPRNKRVVVWLGDEGTASTALSFLEKLRAAVNYDDRVRALTASGSPGALDVEYELAHRQLGEKLFAAARLGITDKQFLDEIATPAERKFLEWKLITTRDGEIVRGLSSSSVLTDTATIEACDDLFRRPYWSRTWILQEIIHHREVAFYIGDLEPIPIEHICQMADGYRQYTGSHVLQDAKSRSVAEFELRVLLGGTAVNMFDIIHKMRSAYAAEEEGADWPLIALLYTMRAQLATDPRDRIYGLLGMSLNGYKIEPDYHLSKETLYTRVTRKILSMHDLVILLWAESPTREIGMGPLPTWVPDYSLPLTLRAVVLISRWDKFGADQGFPQLPPGESQEPHISQTSDEPVLVLRGIRIGEITEVSDKPLCDSKETFRLFGYEAAMVRYSIDGEDGTPGTICTASWGPPKASVGDIIVVARGARVPLVLRATEDQQDKFMFVGGCWLVNSELQDFDKLDVDPGFSPVMFGSACKQAQPGDVEMFHII